MTTSLIDSAALIAIKTAQQETVRDLDQPMPPLMSQAMAERMSASDWKRAYGKAAVTIADHAQLVIRERRHGHDIAAFLLDSWMDLMAFGLDAYGSKSPTARQRVITQMDRTLDGVWVGFNHMMRLALTEGEKELRAQIEQELAGQRRQLDEERELLTHAADQAQAEASAARRDAEQARRELAEAKERHRENGQKNRDLAAEEVRRAKASEKEARSLAQQQAAQLEAQARELESLRAQLADRDSAVSAQEAHTFPPAPEATTQHQEEELMPVTNLDTPLEALSYRAWLALAGHDAEASDKTRTVTCGTATAATLAAWRAECPTPEQQQGMVFRAFRQRRGSVAA